VATVELEGVVEMKRWLRAIIRIMGINIIILLQAVHSNIFYCGCYLNSAYMIW
jgi:hypothetical protein